MSTAQKIIDRAQRVLGDPDNVRWPIAELIDWLNEGREAIILGKPSANSASVEFPLVAGTRQQAPSTGTPRPLRILDFERNVTTDGNVGTQGRVITVTSRNELDALQPDWHNSATVRFRDQVKHCIFDEANPYQFFVYPGNTGQGRISALMSVLPAALTQGSDEIGFDPIYDAPLLDYLMFRCFTKDNIEGVPERAILHAQAFAALIGTKIEVEGVTSPNTRRKKP